MVDIPENQTKPNHSNNINVFRANVQTLFTHI